jgi:hypothetical protein
LRKFHFLELPLPSKFGQLIIFILLERIRDLGMEQTSEQLTRYNTEDELKINKPLSNESEGEPFRGMAYSSGAKRW